MNKKYLLTLAIAGAVAAGFAAKKDPAVMRIAGRDVPRSEFEYLYNKNAGQQLEQQSLEEYAELFKIYKLKVADALAEQLDTTAAFRKEFRGYAKELAAPYMLDSAYYYQLMHEIYDRQGEEVEVKHIMFFKPREFGGVVSRQAYTRADSVLTALRAGADFETLARELSQDRTSAERGGSMGYFTAGMLPYDFETAAYTLRPGEISEIVESPVGVHILMGGKHRKARGTVQAQHILLFVPEDATPEKAADIKALIDSVYHLATAPGADFEKLAQQYSQDRASARQGGNVGWFGVGRMLPEFDSAAFALATGQISEPVRTRVGWHIIKKTGEKPVPSYAESEPMYRRMLDRRDGAYARLLYKQFGEKLAKRYNRKTNKKLLDAILASAAEHSMDSTFYATWSNNSERLASWADTTVTVADFMSYLSRFAPETSPKAAPKFVSKRFDDYVTAALYVEAIDHLPADNIAYRNLLGEYHDGMLLFEVSNRKVWDRAAKDTEGLERFFEANRADYTWKTPHVKGVLVQAPSDSVAEVVRTRIATLPDSVIVETVRKEFPDVKIDEILVAKGENILADALAFGGEPVKNPDSKYPAYFISRMRVITEPEVAADVRAQVTSDYQNELERLWIEQLRATYPVEVFPKELKKVKSLK